MYNFVISHYSRPWKGIVIDKKKRYGMGALLLILVIAYRNNNTPRKREIKILDESYVKEIPAINIDHINKDWLYINQFHPAVKNRGFYN